MTTKSTLQLSQKLTQALPIGWQFAIALEAEACFQFFVGHDTSKQSGIYDANGQLLPIGWFRGTQGSRRRFWHRWTSERSAVRLGRWR